MPLPGLRSRDLIVDIGKNHLKVAVKNAPAAIIDDRLQHDIKKEESTWLIEDKQTLLITLEKVRYIHHYHDVSIPTYKMLGQKSCGQSKQLLPLDGRQLEISDARWFQIVFSCR